MNSNIEYITKGEEKSFYVLNLSGVAIGLFLLITRIHNLFTEDTGIGNLQNWDNLMSLFGVIVGFGVAIGLIIVGLSAIVTYRKKLARGYIEYK